MRIALVVCLAALGGHTSRVHAEDCRYMGLAVPRERPEVFAPTLSAGRDAGFVTNPVFAPDFRHFVFTAVDNRNPQRVQAALFVSRCRDGVWSAPRPAAALNHVDFTSSEAQFSPDGRWLYFSSNRPPGARPWIVKVFRARLNADDFGAPELVDVPAPEKAGLFYPRFDAAGALLLTSDGLPGARRGDIWRAAPGKNGGYTTPIRFPGDINSDAEDWDLVEHPDGTLRIWASGRPGGAGRIDLWYSRRRGDGAWSAAKNLARLNTDAVETAPAFGPDGKALFFQRQVAGHETVYWLALEAAFAPGE
jgi:hypothetical protein